MRDELDFYTVLLYNYSLFLKRYFQAVAGVAVSVNV